MYKNIKKQFQLEKPVMIIYLCNLKQFNISQKYIFIWELKFSVIFIIDDMFETFLMKTLKSWCGF